MSDSDAFSMTACGHNTKDEEAPESYVASFFDIPDSVTYISKASDQR